MKRVAITGMGLITPAGRGIDALWDRLSSGGTCLRPINYFDPSPYGCQVAGQVSSVSEPRVLTPAMMAQTDRCSQMGLVAVLDALEHARLPLDFRAEGSPVAALQVSLSVATIGAGWTYVEQEMKNLWTQGVSSLNRYGLTAGFPAGPQGHIGIFFGVEGRTRTFLSERTSGAQALIEAAKVIKRGDAKVVIAGGSEAPITPLSWSAYDSSRMLRPVSHIEDLEENKQPGLLISEGSTFLILEEREHALDRGVPILAEICGWNRGTDPFTPENLNSQQPGRGLARGIQSSLRQAEIQPEDIDMIFPAGPALKEEDEAEEAAIRTVFSRSPTILSSKSLLGHLLGAAIATEIAIAALMLDRQMIPSHIVSSRDISSEHSSSAMKHALILSAGLGGAYASLIVSKSD